VDPGRRTSHNEELVPDQQEAIALNTAVLAVVGLIVLILLSVCVGISLDTRVQRRERQLLAEERRLYAEIQQWMLPEQERALCDHCPYRDLTRRRWRRG
jgi:hypothetical protein